MEGYITFTQLGTIIVFLLVVWVGGYALIVLRHLNAVAKDISGILKNNREYMNRTMPQLATVTENAAVISSELKLCITEASRAIETISRDTTDTVMKFNETADQIAGYAIVIGEIAKAIANVFSVGKKG